MYYAWKWNLANNNFWQNCILAFEKFQVLSDHEWRVLSRTGLFVLHWFHVKMFCDFDFQTYFILLLYTRQHECCEYVLTKVIKCFCMKKQAKWQKSLMINLFLRTIDLFMSLLVTLSCYESGQKIVLFGQKKNEKQVYFDETCPICYLICQNRSSFLIHYITTSYRQKEDEHVLCNVCPIFP